MIKNFDELKKISAKCASCLDAKLEGTDDKRHIVLTYSYFQELGIYI